MSNWYSTLHESRATRALKVSLCCLTALTALSACESYGEKDDITQDPIGSGQSGENEKLPAIGQDPVNVVHAAVLDDGKVQYLEPVKLARDAFSAEAFERVKKELSGSVREIAPEDRLHPELRGFLAREDTGERLRVIVTLKENAQIPFFPEPDHERGRESLDHQRSTSVAGSYVDQLRKERQATWQQKLSTREAIDAGTEVGEIFWLINAAELEIQSSALKNFLADDDVLYIEPVQTKDYPPQNSNNSDDVDDGRASIVSDPYFNIDSTRGYIGLLDTGIRSSHVLFNGPDNIDFEYDCINGGSDCNDTSAAGFNPDDDCWNHGTRSAAIVTGNNRLGGPFRGVTGITVDSLKVYPTSFNSSNQCDGGLNSTATVRAFERAVEILDRVIIAEMQGSGDRFSAISMAADAAFDAGAVVVAANGNFGPSSGTVNAPANAHRVLGVGNFDVQTNNQVNSQSRGPTGDNRIKPGIQMPTNTETGSTGCAFQANCTGAGNDSALSRYSGTSGAVPYAGGAAALARNFLRGSGSIDPGQVYAFMIMAGNQPFPFNNTSGAGPVRMPTNGRAWWGKVTIDDGETIDIPISLSGDRIRDFDAALWWPEGQLSIAGFDFEYHNDIDLTLIDPLGIVRDVSTSGPSVFERVRSSGDLREGTWRLRIRANNSQLNNQTVYFAAHVRNR